MQPKLLIGIFLFVLFACTKSEATQEYGFFEQTPIFSSSKEAFDAVAQYLNENYPTEKLVTVGNISYIHTATKTLAIVFYQTNTGEHNMLVEKGDTMTESFSNRVTVCEGTECNCKVTAIIDNQGNVKIDCNCESCDKITTEL